MLSGDHLHPTFSLSSPFPPTSYPDTLFSHAEVFCSPHAPKGSLRSSFGPKVSRTDHDRRRPRTVTHHLSLSRRPPSHRRRPPLHHQIFRPPHPLLPRLHALELPLRQGRTPLPRHLDSSPPLDRTARGAQAVVVARPPRQRRRPRSMRHGVRQGRRAGPRRRGPRRVRRPGGAPLARGHDVLVGTGSPCASTSFSS